MLPMRWFLLLLLFVAAPAASQEGLKFTFPDPVKFYAPHGFPCVTPAKVVDKVPFPPGRFVP